MPKPYAHPTQLSMTLRSLSERSSALEKAMAGSGKRYMELADAVVKLQSTLAAIEDQLAEWAELNPTDEEIAANAAGVDLPKGHSNISDWLTKASLEAEQIELAPQQVVQPITKEWLLSVGFSDDTMFAEIADSAGNRWGIADMGAIGWKVLGTRLLLKTRRDVRLLCQLLRLELKEPTNETRT